MNVIITGASRGIGYELVKLFTAIDDNVVVAISRNVEVLVEMVAAQRNATNNTKLIPIAYDLENLTREIDDFLVKRISEYISHVDILINNAGYLVNKPFSEVTFEESVRFFTVNFFAAAELIKKLMSLMGHNGKSHVINIGSMGGFQGSVKFPGLAYYSASKAALASLTECLAEEYKDGRIAFNCLALGAAQTEMLEEAFPDYQAPLKANQIAEFIADFSTNGHRFFNGKIIPVALSTP